MRIRNLLAAAVIVWFAIAPALAVDYVIQRRDANTPPYITAPWGTWQGTIATSPGIMAPNNGLSSHILEFEFITPDYFRDDNAGHFAAAVRGNYVGDVNGVGSYEVGARGIIIGSVQDHRPDFGLPCGPTSKPSTIAIEDFWTTTANCLYGGKAYGGALESPKLQNNKRYKVRIGSYYLGGARYITQYILWDKSSGLEIGRGTTVDDLNPTSRNLGGWFITEVASQHNWTFYIYNLTESWQTTAPAVATCANKVPIYTSQYSQPGRNDRYLTTSPIEHHIAQRAGYADAGIITAYLEPSSRSNTALYRRFYNPVMHNHIMTYDNSEIAYLLNNGWLDDGSIGYIYTSQVSGTRPLYRLWKNHNGIYDVEHRYTTDWSVAYSLQQQGWGYDGVYGYVCP